LRINIAAFIAGGSLLLFLPAVPEYWYGMCAAIFVVSLFGACINCFLTLDRHISSVLLTLCSFALGFAWNAYYAQSRLDHILSTEYEGKDLVLAGRVNALPQSSSSGAKFSFEVDKAFLRHEPLESFPPQVYLSWQPAWRNPQDVPEIIPGQRWEFMVKIKRPYGSLNPHTFDFERWSFHQDFGASGSVRSGKLILEKDIGITEFALAMEYQRWKLRKKIHRLLPKEARYGGVIAALVMGDMVA